MTLNLSQTFVADLAHVFATLQPKPYSAAFLSDLAQIHGDLPVASETNLLFLASRFQEWRKTINEFVHTHLGELSEDDPLRCPISLFRTMDHGRLETAHTRVLAWLLDPRKEHGFGDKLLAALLSRFDSVHVGRFHVERVASEFSLEWSAGEGRFDVLAQGEWESTGKRVPWTLVIEAKVDAGEEEGQLDNYDDWLRSHAADHEIYRVFLTPDGRAPDTGAEEWEPLSFLELVQSFRGVYDGLRLMPGFHFLRFYLAGVLQDVCLLPRNLGVDAADPYAVASYLKTVRDSRSKEASHDAAR
jgi:hypothetical protein